MGNKQVRTPKLCHCTTCNKMLILKKIQTSNCWRLQHRRSFEVDESSMTRNGIEMKLRPPIGTSDNIERMDVEKNEQSNIMASFEFL